MSCYAPSCGAQLTMNEIVLASLPGQTSNFSWDEPNLVSELRLWKVRRLA